MEQSFSDANWRSNSRPALCIKYIENSAYLSYAERNLSRIDPIFDLNKSNYECITVVYVICYF